MEGKLQIRISGPTITNKSGVRTTYSSNMDEALCKISKILKIHIDNIKCINSNI